LPKGEVAAALLIAVDLEPLKRSLILIKKYFAFLLSVFIVTLSVTPYVSAQTSVEVEKTRSKVQQLSAESDKKVEVKLRDNTKYKGYITAVDRDSFTFSDEKTSQTQKFAFSEVQSVKKSGGGISTKTWLIIGGVAAGSIITWAIVKPAFCDGGAQTRGIC
jgi:small nuclear ribonucleoprotein (snRNP)-like protein